MASWCGMTNDNLNVLANLKKRLLEEKGGVKNGLTGFQWDSLNKIASDITEACKSGNLGDVAKSTRRMKNKLRKRSFKKVLEDLESNELKDPNKPKVNTGKVVKGDIGKSISKNTRKDDDKPDGECSCSKCGKTIDGSSSPCLDNVLCTKCALDKTTDKDKDKDKNKNNGSVKNKADKNNDSFGDKSEDNVSMLRKRRY